MCSGKRGWEVRDPGCGRRLLLRWDPELKCSRERGQVHTAPYLPLPATRGPPAGPRRTAEPRQDTGQVSRTPTLPSLLVWQRKLPGWWEPSVVPLDTGRAGPAASAPAGCGMLLLPEPYTILTADGIGWDGMGRDRMGRVARSGSLWFGGAGPTPCSGNARQLHVAVG